MQNVGGRPLVIRQTPLDEGFTEKSNRSLACPANADEVPMKADEILASKLFTAGQQLRIPLWQRHYSWGRPEWAELWHDIRRVQKEKLPGHFLGSVVLQMDSWSGLPSEAHRFWVVDGQQRVTTLTILVCAIRDRLSQLQANDDLRQKMSSELTAQLLVNTTYKQGHTERLVLQDKDHAGLSTLVSGRWDGQCTTQLDYCYAFFREQLQLLEEGSLDELLRVVQTKLTAVWVTLEHGDNAHRVFQTLNAGGKKLRQVDLVRNYFFLLLGQQGDGFYEHSWRQMESDLSERQLDAYLVAWTISQGYSGGQDSLFIYFHKELQPKEASCGEVLEYGRALTASSKLFRWMRVPRDSSYRGDLLSSLQDLANWSTAHALPADGLILFLLRQHQAGSINDAQAAAGIEIALAYMARRQMAGYEPNLHKSIFVSATKRLVAADALRGENVIRYLHYILSKGTDVREWPRDEDVRAAAKTTPLYSAARRSWAFGVLERINRAMFKSKKTAPPPLDRSRYSVEHVMPQTISDAWVEDLTEWGADNPSQLHQSHLHVLGNLTLTQLNPELGNLRFQEKKKLLTDDVLKLNGEVAASSTWTENRINERSAALAALACRAYLAPMSEDDLDQAEKAYRALEPLPGSESVESDSVEGEFDDEGSEIE
jgi:hypothetical protein